MALVEIAPPEFDVNLNLIYATEHNFTGAPGAIFMRMQRKHC